MRSLPARFLVCSLTIAALHAGESGGPLPSGISPDKSLRWELTTPPGAGAQITLTDARHRRAPVSLPAPDGFTGLLISPDSRRLIATANPARLFLFAADSSGAFPPAPVETGGSLPERARLAAGSAADAPWKTTDLQLLAWSADSRLVLLSLSGEGGGLTLTHHLCVLDPSAAPDAPLPDLASFQTASVTPWPEDNSPAAIPYKSLGYADGVFLLDSKPFTGITTDHYPSGLLRRRYHLEDGHFHGLIEEWYETAHQKARTEYVHGKHHGSNIYWNPDGSLQVQKFWENDVLVKEEKAP